MSADEFAITCLILIYVGFVSGYMGLFFKGGTPAPRVAAKSEEPQ
jgi:hypothetical protein